MSRSNGILHQHHRNCFNHTLVDESQDTNRLQYAWLKLMVGGNAAMFAVGDDDQSTYRFRGAYVGNMITLMEELHIGASVELEQSYRPVGSTLTAANTVIENNDEYPGRNLRTGAETGGKIRYYSIFTDPEEAQFIVNETKALECGGWDLGEITVPYRSNVQSRIVERSLSRSGIPYKIYGGPRFYERQKVKHAFTYLRLAANPNGDSAPLRVINFPSRGIGAHIVENLQTASSEQGIILW